MYESRHGGRRISPRRASLEDSENECEGRLSVGTSGPPSGDQYDCAPAKTNPENARSPLTATNNGGEPPPPQAASSAASTGRQANSAPLTPTKVKPPSAPGVSRFGFKPPGGGGGPGGSLSPRTAATTAGMVRSSRLPSGGGGSSDRSNGSHDPSALARAAAAALSPTRTRSGGAVGTGAGGVGSGGGGGGFGGRPDFSRGSSSRGQVAEAARPAVSRTTRSRTAAGRVTTTATGAGSGSAQQRAGGAAVEAAGGRARRPGAAGIAGGGRVNTRSASGTAAQSSRRMSHKLAQPIAVSGRLTRTATKVKPRLEYAAKPAAGRSADRGGARTVASPASGRAKRGASAREGGGMSVNRRVHKSPRTSIDRDFTPARGHTATPDGRVGIRVHAQRILTVPDEEIEELLKTKVKGASKWDYKTRIHNQNELLSQLRAMLSTMLQQKQRFKDACIDTEAGLKAEMRQVNSRCEDVERDHLELVDENSILKSTEAGLKADFKLASADRAELRAECERLKTMLEAQVADEEARTGEAEEQLAMAREKLAWAEAQASASLAQKEQEWEARIDTATSGAHQEVATLEARLDHKDMELESMKEDNADLLQKMSSTLLTFATSQRAADERESELKAARRTLEERLSTVEAEKLMMASREASEFRAELVEARMKAQQASETLIVEKQARLRAETKEEDERRERISTTAQTAAIQQQHSKEMETERLARAKLETEASLKAQSATVEKAGLREKMVLAEERQLELEAEVRSLKAAVVDAQTNAEQLEEMSRAQGELDVVRHRLETLSREKEDVTVGASAKIEELEAKVLEGELQRRKMHNLIQELRGNVRVFARVRPFLPSDGVSADEVPAVVGKGDGVGCIVSKRLVGDNGKELPMESQAFTFDKCFPPSSAGQEEVFTEVSEFVQSALDGFNVCLFSYGQTGSGKTHTMQGSGAGPMRGMIPRAMEQVGKYKSKLEAQGWVYEMEVSFLEIYNEQIRDLLRGADGSKVGERESKFCFSFCLSFSFSFPFIFMDRAACHRSVGRTDMNEQSSRSHSVFTLYLKAVNQMQRSSLKGTLHLVDLAGSERLSRSNATGDRLKETVAINKSLSSLTDVFVSISNKSSHIPFRNSKLTYLLQPALSGDGKTLMMVNLSPTDQSYHESLCSLRFASQVNQCELGRPKRNLRDIGSSENKGPSSRKGPGRP
eukprot:jgi/Undpi1/13487/HiC_scaffold_8.g03146.m1